MSRAIKFRAYHKQEQRMYEVRTIYFPHDMRGKQVESHGKSCIYAYTIGDEIELMQFTGLKDRNEKEVYEGDIVRANIEATEESHFGDDFDRGYWIGEVIYQGAGFHIRQANDTYTPMLMNYCITSLEVLGNIYENSDLLEGAK